jgi:hypothetical protein
VQKVAKRINGMKDMRRQKEKREGEKDMAERKNGRTKGRKKERKKERQKRQGHLALRTTKFLVESEYAY